MLIASALLLSTTSSHAASGNQSTPVDAPTVQILFTNHHSSGTSIDFQYTFSLELTNATDSTTLTLEGYAGLGFIELPNSNPVYDTGLEEEQLSGEYWNSSTCTYESVFAAWEDIATDGNEIDDGFYVWKVKSASHSFDLITMYDDCMSEVDFQATPVWSGSGALTCRVTICDP